MSTDEFVYILSNISYPDDLFKIGSTRVSPSNRAYQLQSSGVPTPFTVEYVILTPNCRDLEQKIHGHLNNFRVNHKREFFKIDKQNLYKILTDEMTLQLIPFSEFHYGSKPTHATQTEPETEHETEPETEHESIDDATVDETGTFCSICDLNFSTVHSLQTHLKSNKHHKKANNIVGFPCECGKTYRSRQNRHNHRVKCNVYADIKKKKENSILMKCGNKVLLERINQLQADIKIKDLENENLKLKHQIKILELENKLADVNSKKG